MFVLCSTFIFSVKGGKNFLLLRIETLPGLRNYSLIIYNFFFVFMLKSLLFCCARMC